MMTIKNNQKGIAPLIIVLVLSIAAILGFAGWKVYDSNNNNDAPPQKVNSTVQQTEPVAELPGGFVAYQNDELGIAFAYPGEWGSVTTSKGPEIKHLIAGSEYLLSFSKNSEVTAGMLSTDWKHDPEMGHDGMVYAGAELAYHPENQTRPTNIKLSDNSYMRSGPIAALGCYGVGHELIHKFTGKKYLGIGFIYYDKKSTDGDNEDPLCDDSAHKPYLNMQHAEQLKKINETIRFLN